MSISYKPQHSAHVSPAVIDEDLSQSSGTAQSIKAMPPRRKLIWGGRTFRFNLRSFRLDEGLSLRRFSVVEGAFLLMLALLASRVLGVVRQVVFNALFGAGADANAFYAAARFPDALFTLIAGGALINAFVPVFLSYGKEKGEQEAWQLTSLVFNLLLVVMTLILLISEFCAPAFVSSILVPGYSPAEQGLITKLTRIMLLQPLFLGLGTVVTSILNSKRQFILPALALAVYNTGLIGGLVVSRLVPGIGIYGPTYGMIASAIIQLMVQLPGLKGQGLRYSFTWNLRHPGLRQVIYLLLPNALALSVAYVGNIIDTNYASYLPDSASLSAIHNADLLQSLPLGLIAQAIGQSLLPHLAVQATAKRYVRMRQMALKVMGVSIFITLPAAVVLAVTGRPLIALLFQHGAFDTHAANLTHLALLGYASSLPGLAAVGLISGGFFALKDAWTPFLTNTYALIVRCCLLYVLFHWLSGTFAILAIPLAITGSATTEALLQCLLLLFRLHKKIELDQGMVRLQRRRRYQERLAVR